MSGKRITFPDAGEMLNRLLRISQEIHYREGLYPKIIESAGKDVDAQGIVEAITLAINDYAGEKPDDIADLVYARVPEFIDALVDDKELAAAAKEFFHKIRESTPR